MGHRSPVPTYQKFAQDIDQFWSFKSAVPHWCNLNLCRSWLIESERSPNSSCPRNPSTTAKWPFFKYRSHSEYHWTHKKQQCLPSGKSTKQNDHHKETIGHNHLSNIIVSTSNHHDCREGKQQLPLPAFPIPFTSTGNTTPANGMGITVAVGLASGVSSCVSLTKSAPNRSFRIFSICSTWRIKNINLPNIPKKQHGTFLLIPPKNSHQLLATPTPKPEHLISTPSTSARAQGCKAQEGQCYLEATRAGSTLAARVNRGAWGPPNHFPYDSGWVRHVQLRYWMSNKNWWWAWYINGYETALALDPLAFKKLESRQEFMCVYIYIYSHKL